MNRFGISFQSDKSIPEYRALADAVADYPFETASIYQDLLFQPPWPGLFQFAERTSSPLVGCAVVNPYLTHPILVAGHLAMLDDMSRGRAYLGVGRGAFLDAIGVAQPRPLRAIRETVEITQRFLSGDREPYDGEIFKASADAYLRFPIPSRRLPVMIGGWGPKTLALAGEIGDMAKVGGCANPDSIATFRGYLDKGAARAGRDPKDVRLMFGTVTVVDRDAAIAESVARQNVAMYVGVTGRMDPGYEMPEDEMKAVESALEKGDETAAGAALSKETLGRFCTYGTPKDIIAHMEHLFDAGLDLFEFGTPHGVDEGDAIRLLGEEVLPHFADR